MRLSQGSARVEHDIENYQERGLRYAPKAKAEVNNTNRGLDNCRYHAKTEFKNYFIMYSKPKNNDTTNMRRNRGKHRQSRVHKTYCFPEVSVNKYFIIY